MSNSIYNEAILALKAWNEYHLAIYKKAEDGDFEIDARGAIAEGKDLDSLYFDAMTKMEAVLEKASV